MLYVIYIYMLFIYIYICYIYTSSSWKLMPEDDSKESKHIARIIINVILK